MTVLAALEPSSPATGHLQVMEYTDPHSIWCWGCEPIIRRLEYVYDGALDVHIVMGGLFEDFTPMKEQWMRMSGDRWKDSVLSFMNGVAWQHRMPMDSEGMIGAIDDFESTWPACIAAKAAEAQGWDAGRRYLRRLREAFLIEGRAIHRREVQRDLAAECGLDMTLFRLALDDGSAERAFQKDLRACREKEVSGFPTFEIRGDDASLRLEGFQPWHVFEDAIRTMDPGLTPRTVEATTEGILDMLDRYGVCAGPEVAAVFEVSDDRAELLLDELEAVGAVHRREAGSGLVWERAGATEVKRTATGTVLERTSR